jgi:hypothetical protein
LLHAARRPLSDAAFAKPELYELLEATVAGDDAILRISGDEDYTDCRQM